MHQRTQFIADFLRHTLSITARCALYGVSRKCGYKWIDRYLHDGAIGLQARSRKPNHSPRQTPAHVIAALIEARRHHPTWAPGSCWQFCVNAILAGPGPRALRGVTS